MKKLIYLAKQYDCVVGDKFELFYRGVICSMNPYKYDIHIDCIKGMPFPRYFSYLPKEEDCGDYELVLSLRDDYYNVIESASTTLHVVKPIAPAVKNTILCVGDSLTFNGVWCHEGYRRFTQIDGEPRGNGFKDSIELVGTCKKSEIGYEGYGGWSWRHFVTNEIVSSDSCCWIEVKEHCFDSSDQHSIWESNNLLWILESITKNKLKFKRGLNNNSLTPSIGTCFHHVSGGTHYNDVEVLKYQFEKGNPFYDELLQRINFRNYCNINHFKDINYMYVLLSWNGQYQPFNNNFSHFTKYIEAFLDQFHEDFPNGYIRLLGIQSPSINGGLAFSYGASGVYSDAFGEVVTAYNYDSYLEEICCSSKYHHYCKYIDMKAQFDVEYNMPYDKMKVNARSNIVEIIGTNGVHPSMDGYLQIGDVFYRALVSDIAKEQDNE